MMLAVELSFKEANQRWMVVAQRDEQVREWVYTYSILMNNDITLNIGATTSKPIRK